MDEYFKSRNTRGRVRVKQHNGRGGLEALVRTVVSRQAGQGYFSIGQLERPMERSEYITFKRSPYRGKREQKTKTGSQTSTAKSQAVNDTLLSFSKLHTQGMSGTCACP